MRRTIDFDWIDDSTLSLFLRGRNYYFEQLKKGKKEMFLKSNFQDSIYDCTIEFHFLGGTNRNRVFDLF